MKRQRIGHCLALASIILIGGGLGVSGFGPAVAQEDTPGGTTLTFGIETSLSVSDNYNLATTAPGTSTILDTTLSFGYLSETANDRFAFDIDGVVRASDIPGVGGDVRFDDVNAALSYTREGANSRFSVTTGYNRVNLDFLDPFELANLTDASLITGSGTRLSRTARLIFETGTSGPLGFGVELGTEAIGYSNTTDPGLFDSQTDDIALTSRLRLSPVAEGRVRLSQEEYGADDLANTDRTTRALSFGVAYELSAVTTLDVIIGTSKIDEAASGTSRGSFGTATLTRALANGTAGVILDRSFGIEGGRTTLSANRSMDLPSGTLAYSLGVTRGELGGTEVIGSVAYSQTLPRGTLTASLDRSVDSTDAGNDELTTTANLGYVMALSPLANLSLQLDYVAVDDAGSGTVTGTNRSAFRAEYSRELTPDWDLSAGYEHQREATAGSGTAKSNTVFLTLGRDFSIRR